MICHRTLPTMRNIQDTSFPKDNSFPTEQAFQNAIKNAGGSLVDDRLDKSRPLPENADFVFEKYNVIVELKNCHHGP
jgi:hypothetical protein